VFWMREGEIDGEDTRWGLGQGNRNPVWWLSRIDDSPYARPKFAEVEVFGDDEDPFGTEEIEPLAGSSKPQSSRLFSKPSTQDVVGPERFSYAQRSIKKHKFLVSMIEYWPIPGWPVTTAAAGRCSVPLAYCCSTQL
jgi:hypothetical protein